MKIILEHPWRNLALTIAFLWRGATFAFPVPHHRVAGRDARAPVRLSAVRAFRIRHGDAVRASYRGMKCVNQCAGAFKRHQQSPPSRSSCRFKLCAARIRAGYLATYLEPCFD
jgi:hypothetical protein